jgi:hypothetical protein
MKLNLLDILDFLVYMHQPLFLFFIHLFAILDYDYKIWLNLILDLNFEDGLDASL